MNVCGQGFTMAWTERYHYYGIKIIQWLQHSLKPIIPLFEFTSLIVSPSIAYHFIFPITFFISPHLGLSIIWSATISEAINLLLQILLHGDRPYWWARENADKYRYFTIKQYRTTCEVSAGTPSDHAFISSAVWATMMFMWCNWAPNKYSKMRTTVLSFLVLVLVCLGQIVIGANFPHQVLVGVILGVGVAYFVARFEYFKRSPIFYFEVAALFLVLGLIIKFIFPTLELCSCWSVIKAKKYCKKLDWVRKYSSKPFISFLKLASILVGTGLAMLIITAIKSCKVFLKKDTVLRCISALLSLMVTSYIYFGLSKYQAVGPPLFSFIILKNMMIPLTVIVLVPLLTGIYEN